MSTLTFIIPAPDGERSAQDTLARLSAAGAEAEIWQNIEYSLKAGERVSNLYHYAMRGAPVGAPEVQRYLSHYRLLQYALQQKCERIFVFEGSLLPSNHLAIALEQLAASDSRCEFVSLYEPAERMTRTLTLSQAQYQHALSTGHILTRQLRPAFTARGYMLTRTGLEKLLPHLMPITRTIGAQISDCVARSVLNGSVILPSLAQLPKNDTIREAESAQPSARAKFIKRLTAPVRQFYYAPTRFYAMHDYLNELEDDLLTLTKSEPENLAKFIRMSSRPETAAELAERGFGVSR